ncbi:glucosaminidase domain-containing protein [Paenibacillus glycinis]|uniref:Mannosyl-glycoprotein endo-beta-N-acetylglucosamidase-like domain-containing protein n=1 Tax=Paenibacillus glycinis TaxID=2697035 RepID=A0ABW9XLK0_9BACL|nr:glucosaminidase domain-containing protein [Paenibacillus glycinis]NBD23324.1 hypothetical protein [Paenibacillus glycinis]
MSRSIQWNVVAYMTICAALLASLFVSFNLPASVWNKSSSDFALPRWHGQLPVASALPQPAPIAQAQPKSEFQPATVIPKAPPVTAAAVPAKTKTVSPPIETPLHTYKVTSFYLNVRALPSADADILRVVEQGTLLQVQQVTPSGWLSMKDGGYVNGRYAEAADPAPTAKTTRPDSPVSILSASASASAAFPMQANQAPQPKLQAKTAASGEAIALPAKPSKAGNPVKPTSKVMSASGMTKEHVAMLLKGTKLSGLGLEDVILGVEEKYGINAFFTIAVMKLESGNGKSTLSRTKNNLFGLNATTGNAHKMAFSFKTKGDSIRKFGQLINDNYVERGLTTIEKVARKYCPANGLWAGHVRTIMRSDYGKLD